MSHRLCNRRVVSGRWLTRFWRWGVVVGGALVALAIGGPVTRGADAKQKETPKKRETPLAVVDYQIGEPIIHKNLTVFPILSTQPRNEDRYTTLDEGLKAGTIKIVETGAEADNSGANSRRNSRDGQVHGDVNRVLLLNRSKKPLYLMPGEIIIGGKQDRTIAQETIVPPGDKPTELQVFCVEHGRWAGRGAAEVSTLAANLSLGVNANSSALTDKSTDAKRLAAKAQSGEFIGSAGNVSKEARLAVQADKDQGKVWDKVAEANAKSGVQGKSGYFTGNYVEQDSLKRLAPYVSALEKKVDDQTQIVGVAIAIDGKLDTLDVFESTPLFRHLWPKLLKSYALDAANASHDANATHDVATTQAANAKPNTKALPNAGRSSSSSQSPSAATVEDARKFLAEALSPRGKKTANGDVAVTTVETEHVLSFSAEDSRRSDRAPTAASMGGGYGGVHVNGFAK